ncbi:FixH family protein [Uliginosibacterium flavum]|uniref:FixH family protein n=1 Tax=Uliginosibacterium flavum TaxID=1396831 RepID=A0ABV2TLD8_9RHOO
MSRPIQAVLPLRPWYREPWPWLLMSLPMTAVVAGLATWALASRTDDGLVAQDYYKKGLTINRVLARQERAAQLGLGASLRQSGGHLILTLESSREIEPAAQLRLSLINPARADLDRELLLQREGAVYTGELGSVREGRWNVKLEDEGGVWQLFAETSLPLAEPVHLKP